VLVATTVLLVFVIAGGTVVAPTLTVLNTDPPSTLIMAVYAGAVVKFAYQRHASPSPENALGIQEYLSVKSHTVIPTQFVVARHAPTVLA
jgi:hypothetical protein